MAIPPGHGRGAQHIVLAIVIALGLSASILAAVAVSEWERRLADLQLQDLARNQHQTMNADLSYAAEAVYTLGALFETADRPIGREEYQAFAQSQRARVVGLRDTGWALRVTHAQRAAFEQKIRGEGFPNFQIWERDAQGKPMRAADRDEYFPILYPDPAAVTAKVIGFDVASEPVRSATLRRAIASGRAAATPPINLITVNKEIGGFMAFLPVYGKGAVAGAGREPTGFVYGVFETGRMIENVLAAKTRPTGMDILFFDPAAMGAQRFIHWHSSRTRDAEAPAPAPAPSESELRAGPHWQGWLNVLDREWGVLFRPTEAFVAAAGRWQATAALIAGLAMTSLLVAYLLVSFRRTNRLEFLTARLHRTNADLRLETDKVAQLARHDALTGLVNRATFIESLREAFSLAQRGAGHFTVLYVDLDHFKDINDTLGHSSGDRLLQIVAERLTQLMRGSDVIARLGGDEFAILIPGAATASTVTALAARINDALAQRYDLDGNDVYVSASIGIAPFVASAASPMDVLMRADLALYRAKEAGRNRFSFHSSDLDRRAHERVAIAAELHTGIEKNELELYYQPQVEIASGRVIGMEALVRWNHPARGLLTAAVFIAVAETTGAIHALGRWVLDAAGRQLQAWNAAGLASVPLAVNFSAAQFKGMPNLDRDLGDLLARFGLPPQALEIELTEQGLIEATQANRGLIERIRRHGIGVAIDDFGTGYSSLEYLRTFRVNRLKIAQQFVRDLATNPNDGAICRAAIGLAREFAIEVIAEGVETAEQAARLARLGCRYAQGYYFGHPVPAAEAEVWLRRGFVERCCPPDDAPPLAPSQDAHATAQLPLFDRV